MSNNDITRREFVKKTAIAGSGLLLAQHAVPSIIKTDRKTRYANIGTGSRARMFQQAIYGHYSEHSDMVALSDNNEGRLRLAQEEGVAATGKRIPVFHSDDYEAMIKQTQPDVVIVTTVDSTHCDYIVRAMELGCDVITEKPMTVDARTCQKILDTQRRTGKSCKVTFNYRYSPPRTQIKELLMQGVIGEVLSVDFNWLLNTHHGADYFRRWHSSKEMSGGLMVHKATHHFDLINWWLSAIPVSVTARGKREFYTPNMAQRLGLKSHHQRCSTCPEKNKCGFELSLAANPDLKRLYLDQEHFDGYFRDQCVFRPEIDIEDTMHVMATYNNGVELSYSLNAFNAWEGYTISFNGTRGRIEHKIEEQVYFNGDGGEQGGIAAGGVVTRVIPLRGAVQDIEPWRGEGSHGGGDRLMLDDIFLPQKPEDKYGRAADQRAGAYSILTGVAANRSIETGREILIADLVKEIGYPEYTPMPSRTAPLPMPEKI